MEQYYRLNTTLSYAMSVYNHKHPKCKFQPVDWNILGIVESFERANKKCFMKNETLANMSMCTPRTVITSIKRLCDAGLLEKEKKNGKTILHYKKDAVDEFINENQED